MAVYTGTSGVDTYPGVVGVEDLAIIGSVQGRTTFRLNAMTGGWQTNSLAASLDTLNSIEAVRLNDASFGLRLGGNRIVANIAGAGHSGGITTFANGDYIVAFQRNAAMGDNIFLQRYNGIGEKIGGEVGAVTGGSEPRLLSFSNDTYLVAFNKSDASGSGVYFQRFTAAGFETAGEVLANSFTMGEQRLESQAVLSDASFVLTWQSQNQAGDEQGGIYAQRFNAAGVKLGGEFRVNTVVAGNQSGSDITALSGGGYVVTWLSTNTSYVLQQFTAAGAKVGGEVILFAAGATRPPATVALKDGGYTAIWQEGSEIHAQRFTAAGVKTGGELVIFTPVQGSVANIAATELADGDYVVTWATNESGGTHYSQLFGADGRPVSPVRTMIGSIHFNGVATVEATADGGYILRSHQTGQLTTLRFDSEGLPVLSAVTGDENPNIIAGEGDRIALYGGGGNDSLRSLNGDDLLDGGAGNDVLVGGNGNDYYIADQGDTIVEETTGGTDTVEVRGSYTLTSVNVENLFLAGTAAASLIGNVRNNLITGNNSDNAINGGRGSDRMVGGYGDDTYTVDEGVGFDAVAQPGDIVVEGADAGVDTVISQISYTMTANVENLQLIGTAQGATGNALDNRIVGNSANNVLDGGDGADTLIGGGGDDSYIVDAEDQATEDANGGRDSVAASTSWALGDNFEDLTLLAEAGAANATGNALANVLIGNASANVLDGGAGNDTIEGGGGADVLDGGAGSDVMNGQGGGDTYHVDNAMDQASELSDGGGTDIVFSTVTHALSTQIENLTLRGDQAINGTGNNLNNEIRGNSAANILTGSLGADMVFGGFGNDTLISTDGLDTLYGQAGDDEYRVTGDTDQIVELAGQGNDTVTATIARSYTLSGNVENLILQGGNVDGFGNTLANLIIGTAGGNLIDGGAGADRLIGLAGDDSYAVESTSDVVVEALNEGVDTILASVGVALSANVENLTLTGSAFIDGTGNELDNRVLGNIVSNVLNGGLGNDFLLGDGGSDLLLGGDGDDRLNGGDGNDTLDGGLGLDAASYFNARVGVTVDLRQIAFQETGVGSDRLLNIEAVEGSLVGGDRLTGNDGANQLYGFGGADQLRGGAGDDLLSGGDGNDILFADLGADTIDGGNGADVLSFAEIAANIVVNLQVGGAQETRAGLDTIRNIENIDGSNTGSDQIWGDEFDNVLNGLGGDDLIGGGEGADTLDGGAGFDTADYALSLGDVIVNLASGLAANDGSGAQDIVLNFENVRGSQFDDFITGSASNNALFGSFGDDILAGGLGNDFLLGEEGKDVFVFDSALGAGNVDRLNDFKPVEDQIRLSRSIFTALAGDGALAATAFRVGPSAQDGDDRIVYNSATGALSYDSDGTGAAAAVQFAQLGAGLALSSTDFFVVG